MLLKCAIKIYLIGQLKYGGDPQSTELNVTSQNQDCRIKKSPKQNQLVNIKWAKRY